MDIDALRLMLKTLMVDRSELESHIEERPMDEPDARPTMRVYALGPASATFVAAARPLTLRSFRIPCAASSSYFLV